MAGFPCPRCDRPPRPSGPAGPSSDSRGQDSPELFGGISGRTQTCGRDAASLRMPSLRDGRALPRPPMELVLERPGVPARRKRRCSPGSTSGWPPGRRRSCAGRTAPASPACCASSPGCCRRSRRRRAARRALAGAATAPACRSGVALAGHLDAVKPALTVAENLRLLGRHPRRRARAAPRRRSTASASAPIADRPAGQCSAGQRRRLGLARLLVVDRPLWLLDEPTVSLDAASAALVADLVARARRRRRHGADRHAYRPRARRGAGAGDAGAAGAAIRPPARDAFLEGEW